MAAAKKSDDFDPTTPDGTALGEAVSAMIKELRRGRDLQAMYWAKQIEARFHKYVWKRLLIFAAEDVSIANPNAIVQVKALHDAYLLTRDRKTGGDAMFCPHCGSVLESSAAEGRADKDVLAMAVLLLARSSKCRESNLMWAMLIELGKRFWKPEIPEYALDGHTKRGMEMHPDRNERHRKWFLDWSKVIPNVGPNDAHAWHVRRMFRQGRLSVEDAQQIVDTYEAEGQLVYPKQGAEHWPEWTETGDDMQRPDGPYSD